MNRRLTPAALAVATAAVLGTPSAAQTYDYGGNAYGSGNAGFVVVFEAGIASPRNTDNIVAAVGPNVIIPEWDEEFAGRLGLGYRFADGNEVDISFWNFETDQGAAGIGTFNFPIGPIDGFDFDVKTDFEVNTIDVIWTIPHEVSESFGMDWSLGLRYASFEEATSGFYGTTSGTLAVKKNIETDMLGARVAGRGTYRVNSFSASAGVGLSLLDGEIEARSSLTPQPVGTVPLGLSDDSRSGSILDFDVRAAWHNSRDDLSVWIGWEEQIWEDIAADLARNLPGSEVPARDRESVTISWAKVGVSFLF
jgi:hypothetical protein